MAIEAKDLVGKKPLTQEYSPETLTQWYNPTARAPVFSPYWIPYMLSDSRIQFGLRIIKGYITANTKFWVKPGKSGEGPKPFVCDQINRMWRTSVRKILRAIEWGFSANEAMYCVRDGRVNFDSLRVLHPRDCRVLTADGCKVGISVRNVKSLRNGQSKVYLGGPKGLWHVHNREDNTWYGLSRLFGSFCPWYEKTTDGGAQDVRRLYYHKFAFSGEIGYFPLEDIPAATTGGQMYMNSSKAQMRSVMEKRRAGGQTMFPNTKDEHGDNKWKIVPAGPAPGSADILGWIHDLKSEIFEGMGIPPEVVEAATSGSGWSGRMIPAIAFTSSLMELVQDLITDFDEQVIRPLLLLNEGIAEPDYEIIPFGLFIDEAGDPQTAPAPKQEPPPKEVADSARLSLCV